MVMLVYPTWGMLIALVSMFLTTPSKNFLGARSQVSYYLKILVFILWSLFVAMIWCCVGLRVYTLVGPEIIGGIKGRWDSVLYTSGWTVRNRSPSLTFSRYV